jgi:triacylglycerol lipase
MFGSSVLEVLIGLVLVYLLFSLVCSSLNEGIASMTNRRGKILREAIARLLGEYSTTAQRKEGKAKATDEIYEHALVKALRRTEERDPSYIPNETFAAALMDCIAPSRDMPPSARWAEIVRIVEDPKPPPKGAKIALEKDSDLHTALRVIVQDVRQRIDVGLATKPTDLLAQLELQICQWFERTMQRTSGWYKRKTQLWLLAIGTGLTLLANADSLMLARQLARNPAVRETIASAAAEYVREGKGEASDAKGLFDQARASGIELGYPDPGWAPAKEAAAQGKEHAMAFYVLAKILGLAVTILALMLGAPFWFQTLEKLVKLRGSGTIPPPTPTAAAGIEPPPLQDDSGPRAPAGLVRIAPTAVVAVAQAADFAPGYWDALIASAKPLTRLPEKETELTLLAARLSALAYKSKLLSSPVLQKLGFEEVEYFDVGGTQAFAARCGKSLVISFRGTEPSRVEDILTDARALLTATCFGKGDFVHVGFRDALELVRKPLDAWLAKRQPAAEEILITGHSLGAALATLLFADWSSKVPENIRIELVTFGSPRVGDAKFLACFDERTAKIASRRVIRFVNDQDLVTRVAPRVMGYQHVGSVYLLDAAGRLLREARAIDEWNRFLSLVLDAAFEFKTAARGTVRDHGIHLYVAKLEAVAQMDDAHGL